MDELQQWFKDAAPELKEISYAPSRLNKSELKRLGAKVPSVSIVDVGTSNYTINSCRVRKLVSYVAFVVTGDACPGGRHQSGKRITQALADKMPGSLRHKEGTKNVLSLEPGTLSTQNLTEPAVDEMGLTLWGISWQQIAVTKQEF
jgi:hypothetical protein